MPSRSYQAAAASSNPGTSVGSTSPSPSSADKSFRSWLPQAGQAVPPMESRPQIWHSNMVLPRTLLGTGGLQVNADLLVITLLLHGG